MTWLEDWHRRTTALLQPYPWLAWGPWIAFCVTALARTHPRRLASTFTYYIEAAQRFSAQQQVYDPHTLGEFLYLPIALLILSPLTAIDRTFAGAITLTVYAAVFTFGCAMFVRNLFPSGARGLNPWALAGLLLLVNIPAAWFNFKGVQSAIIMTGAMLAAGAAMMQARWLWASLWLFVAIVFKPLAMVMALLCIALVPRMRLPLIAAILVILVFPFAFTDASYLIDQYRDYAAKIMAISASRPEDWIYRADIMTMLGAIGIHVPSSISLGIRALAAVGTLFLAWRVRREGNDRTFAFAVVLLSACYITLFSPRNEFLSFIVLTPAITALAFVLLARDERDVRGWLLITAALALGMWWSLKFDAWFKPAIDLTIYAWLAYLMIAPRRWNALIGEGTTK